MKKTFKFEIDCANCAQKVEDAANKIEGVISCSVNYIGERLTLEAEDDEFDKVLAKVKKAAKRVEPDCEIYE